MFKAVFAWAILRGIIDWLTGKRLRWIYVVGVDMETLDIRTLSKKVEYIREA